MENSCFTDGNYPFAYRFITPHDATATTFDLRARAFDTGGNSAWSATKTVDLVPDVDLPVVVSVAPVGGGRTINQLQAVFSEPMDAESTK